ncbi:unnamed protein product [Clavelina lepadiformis]|uniref:Uncharacterized protein n=1 Tax=Clavelina lepadiformis TaxID=159417 RepID=A0ABP0H499_CLALP
MGVSYDEDDVQGHALFGNPLGEAKNISPRAVGKPPPEDYSQHPDLVYLVQRAGFGFQSRQKTYGVNSKYVEKYWILKTFQSTWPDLVYSDDASPFQSQNLLFERAIAFTTYN